MVLQWLVVVADRSVMMMMIMDQLLMSHQL